MRVGAPVTVPERLVRPHRFVAASRDAARGIKQGDDARLRIGGREGVVYLVVSREQLHRALLILQALFNAAERQGYELRSIDNGGYEAKAGVAIHVGQHAYRVQLVELTDRVPLSEEEVEHWRLLHRHHFSWEKRDPPTLKSVANGRLKLQLLGRFGGRSSWGEGPRGSLESKLYSILEELDSRAGRDDAQVEEQRRRSEELRRQEEERHERELRARIERARAARLGEEIQAWHLARDVRDYVAALRSRFEELDPAERQRVEPWCDWAEGFAERSDPVRNVARVRGKDDEKDRFFTPTRGW